MFYCITKANALLIMEISFEIFATESWASDGFFPGVD